MWHQPAKGGGILGVQGKAVTDIYTLISSCADGFCVIIVARLTETEYVTGIFADNDEFAA